MGLVNIKMNTLSPIMAKVTHGMRHTDSLSLPIGIGRNNVHHSPQPSLYQSSACAIKNCADRTKRIYIRIGIDLGEFILVLNFVLKFFWRAGLTVPGADSIVPRFAWESFFPKGNASGSVSA